MFELYLDSADVRQIRRFNDCLPLRGVTTNPSILASSGIGVSRLLAELSEVLGRDARFHVQVVSGSVDDMITEARQLNDLPYDVVVKVPATEIGLAAIKRIKADKIPLLATAIYSLQQGFLAALSGADYLAPYVNRIDTLGVDGVGVVADMQSLLNNHGLESKILAASFKSTQQAMAVIKQGVAAITLPLDVAGQMLAHPAVPPAVEQFNRDWREAFGDKHSFES
ncbi:transaldolase family protein [Methylomarinum sp. Ch1-1]|uniref:Transaldolase family protein n=1 Tax=Methylomarinum roseum TaxID=3067653 RepID=A0AAU7NZA8_9GAMM|nr:transaldolase family protein [Methylomarinum sp. Ch1-1]MDP4521583.1 transaldolase family protein [Methylomarinum sp. Ch1-1]